jgi:hypothetical protein
MLRIQRRRAGARGVHSALFVGAMLVAAFGSVTPAWAAGSVALGATAYTENFDTLAEVLLH